MPNLALLALEASDGTVVLTSITLVFAMLIALCLIITLEGKLRGLQEFVRDTAKRAHDNHYTLFLSLIFNDTFQAEDAFYGTN